MNQEEKMWFYGIMAADGNVRDNNSVSISQSGKGGLEIIDYIEDLLIIENKCSRYTYQPKMKNAQLSHKLYCYQNQTLAEELKKYNIVPRKSLVYTLPNFDTISSFRHFLIGYIDGDGCIGIYDNGRGSMSLTIGFVGTIEFIKQCDKTIPLNSSSCHKHSQSEVWELKYTGQKAISFMAWLTEGYSGFKSVKLQKFYDYVNTTPEPVWSKFNRQRVEFQKRDYATSKSALADGITNKCYHTWKKNPMDFFEVGNFVSKKYT